MKVILVNGSPHEKGCIYTALCAMQKVFDKENIESEILWVGNKPVGGCIGCGYCRRDGRCFQNDKVNEFVEKAKEADGFVFGSPVHYASMSGALTSFMDRAFYSGGQHLKLKPAAGILSCRRGGATASFDQINKYFSINEMPIVSSVYWNMVHGNTPEEVLQDLEGINTVEVLAKNMCWLLKLIECGKANGITYPKQGENVKTNFIR